MNIKENLEKYYYNPKTGFIGLEKLYQKVKKIHETITRKDVKEWFDEQEIAQRDKKPRVTNQNQYRIMGPELSFQIDLMFIPRSIKNQQTKIAYKDMYVFLLCVDIISRRAFVYKLKDKTMDEILKGYKLFLSDVEEQTKQYDGTENYYSRHTPFKITSDDEFNKPSFKQALNDTQLDAQLAYNDHITSGDRLAILDRLVRTVKNMVMRVVYTVKNYKIEELLKMIIENYNETPHQGIRNYTPNEVWADKNKRYEIFTEAIEENEGITKKGFKKNDVVRVVDDTGKKGRPMFSKELYEVEGMKGNKYAVKGLNKMFKPHELQKVDKVKNTAVKDMRAEMKTNEKLIKGQKERKADDIKPENIVIEKRVRKQPDRYVPQ